MHLTREKMFENLIKSKLCIVRPTLVYGDGEYLGDLPAEISIGKKPLRVLVPN